MQNLRGEVQAMCRGLRALLLSLALAAGCSTSGSSELLSITHRLLPATEEVAAAMRPTDPRELSKMPVEAFYVQPGDILLLEVLDLEAEIRLPVDQTIMPDGTIDLGQYGRVAVAGMTVEQIEVLVTDRIRTFHDDTKIKPINVQLSVAESAVYYVMGEVNSPGSYPLIGRETILDGIVTAGGLAEGASKCKIIVARPTAPASCRIVLPVCYHRIVQLGDTTTNYQLRPGDRIFVGSKTFCEMLAFWKTDCDRCGDCACPCASGYVPAMTPYAAAMESLDTSVELIGLPHRRQPTSRESLPTP